MVTELGSIKDRLLAAPERKQPLYESLGLALIVDVKKRAVILESQPSCTYGKIVSEDRHAPYVHASATGRAASAVATGSSRRRRGGDEIAQVVRSIKDLSAVVRQTGPEDRAEI
ncbi:hypothetical protein ACFRNT_10885 [Streptomyces sp. NPDC056697]|uniref:hypothetical protein n=1 Tax=Streptomyces sp. NPDC056697 TaxID=3345915 RepID=UPI0036742249